MTAHEGDKTKMISRRAVLIAGGEIALSSILVGQMYNLQVLKYDKYKTLAEKNRISTRYLAPPRGLITDRFGTLMARNDQNFRVLVVSEQTDGNLNIILDTLNKILPLTEHEIQRVRREVRRSRSYTPVIIRENLSWEEMARIQLNSPDLPGIIIDEGLSRYYPFAEQAGHLLGFVGPVSDKELEKPNATRLWKLPGFKIGKEGIELQYNDVLCGKEGSQQVEVNAFGRVIREIERDEGEPGKTLPLTIDARLQKVAFNAFKDHSGSAVLMNIHTGEVLAFVSTPCYNPNSFNLGISQNEWNELINNEKNPLLNKTIYGLYSPGSTFKMIVALAALEAGVITPSTEIECSGYIMNGNQRFHCWKHTGHGKLNLKQAIMHSCDIYFYEIARRTGIDKISAMARRFGLGVPTDIGLPGEKGGFIPTRKWKETIRGEQWLQGDTFNVGIGQGDVLVTPLQLAVMVSTIANDGVKVQPKLIIDDKPPVKEALNISKQHLRLVREGMIDVVNHQQGTAKGARVDVNGQKIAGKTGTVQVRRISMKEREEGERKDLTWKEKNHALFVAYGPIDKPKYALSVVVEHGEAGGSVAGPIAREIFKECLKLDPCSPKEKS